MRHWLLIGVALALLAAGCGSEDEKTFQGVPFEDPGPIHVHGLGLDQQTQTLYIATHTGLWQLPEGAAKATRVTDRLQDTMGFTLVRPGLFLGSGHPDLREAEPDVPPLLGLIESSDNGRTWRQLSLLGKADFHVLRHAGARIYGYDSTHNRLMRSDNGGRSWRSSKVPEPLLDLAIDPADPTHLVASGEVALYESKDAGRRWHLLATTPGYLAWPSSKRLYLFDPQGAVSLSDSPTKRFRQLGSVGGELHAVLVTSETEVYAAIDGGAIKRSLDGGRTVDAELVKRLNAALDGSVTVKQPGVVLNAVANIRRCASVRSKCEEGTDGGEGDNESASHHQAHRNRRISIS